MKSGIYYELPGDEYHSGPGISNSGLGLLGRSPLHYWAKYRDPNREPVEPTPAMQIGTAVHCAVLEPDRFRQEFVTIPADAPKKPTSVQLNAKNPSDATIAAILWWEEFEERNKGATILSADDFAKCQRISESVQRHNAAEILFAEGDAEVSIFWEDEETGVLCKIRPDWLMRTAIFDLKTTEDASAQAFQRSVLNYGYFRQAAFYLDGAQAAGLEVDAFIFGAVEKSAPFASAFYFADEAMLEIGRSDYRRLLRIYAECLETDRWPGYPEHLTPIGLPAWFKPAAANDNKEAA